jgi:WD40 repeat protein
MRITAAATLALLFAGCEAKKVGVPPSEQSTVAPPPEVIVRAASFSPKGTHLLIGFSAQNPLLKLWEVATGEELWKTEAHQGSITSIAFLEDGKRVYTSGRDGIFKLWDIGTRREIGSYSSGEERINHLVVLPDERLLITGHPTGRIKIWETRDGHLVRTLDGGPESVRSLTVSPDGRWVLSTHNGAATYTKMWDIEKGTAVRTIDGLGWGYDACFSPDSRSAVSAKQSGIAAYLVLWEVASGREIRVLKGPLHEILFLAFSPDGKRLFSGGFDYILRCWDCDSGDVVWKTQVRDATAFAISSDGKQIFTAAGHTDLFSNGRQLTLWDAATGKSTLMLRGSPVHAAYRERGPSQ